jgi:hypothetical protein
MFGIKSKQIDYKYNETELLKEFGEYVDKTYDQHYSHSKFQATEFIMDGGHGEGFCIKVIHYGFLALNNHDRIMLEESGYTKGIN